MTNAPEGADRPGRLTAPNPMTGTDLLDAASRPGVQTGAGGRADSSQFELMVLPASALKARPRSKKHGHAAVPGTGPAGETCGGCSHLVRKHLAKTYLKCGLMSAHWTGGEGTDVRAGDPACRRWEKAQSAASA